MRDTIDINSNDNALFVTAQCNNRCVMCCQPPLNKNDFDFLFDKNIALIDSAPPELISIGITGGEPTLLGKRLFELIGRIRSKLPQTEIHLLTNGRKFSDIEFTRRLADCGTDKLLLGVPIHSDYTQDHDAITQVQGSFNETMRGLYNLARFDFGIELRVVLTKLNYQRLPFLPNFIYRNLPFVEYISLMGLEYTGYTVKNRAQVWIEPVDYQNELESAVIGLSQWKMDVSIFNLQHCLLNQSLWPYAKKSISNWKNVYAPCCRECTVKEMCCGLFGTSKYQSINIKPIRSV